MVYSTVIIIKTNPEMQSFNFWFVFLVSFINPFAQLQFVCWIEINWIKLNWISVSIHYWFNLQQQTTKLKANEIDSLPGYWLSRHFIHPPFLFTFTQTNFSLIWFIQQQSFLACGLFHSSTSILFQLIQS